MTTEPPFDPYLKWLGIRPKDQPPHHYRLVGVELFEPEADVISHAADARIAFIRGFLVGEHSARAQRLLDELVAARNCLLKADQRPAYDKALRAYLGMAEAAPTAEPAVPAADVDRLWRRATWGLVAAAAVLTVALLTMVALRARGPVVADARSGGQPETSPATGWEDAATEPRNASLSSREAGEVPTAAAAPRPSAPPQPAAAPPSAEMAGGFVPSTTDDAAAAMKPEPAKPDAADAMKPEAAKPDAAKPPEPAKPDAAAPPSAEMPGGFVPSTKDDAASAFDRTGAKSDPARTAVPPQPALEQAERALRAAMEKEFAAARTPIQKAALADALVARGHATLDDPPTRYVCLSLAVDLAAGAGDLGRASDAAAALEGFFEVEPFDLHYQVLTKANEATRTPATSPALVQEIAETALALMDDALDADNVAAAERFGKLGAAAAKRTKSGPLNRLAAERARLAEKLPEWSRAAAAAEQVLAANAAEPKANLVVGRWRAMVKFQWTAGLPLLARGAEAPLADLAKADLEQPTAADAQLKLADRWFARADQEEAGVREGAYKRAAHWYAAAQAAASAAQQTHIRSRLAAIDEAAPTLLPQRGATRPGNVALASAGAVAIGPDQRELNDGDTSGGAGRRKAAFAKPPCEWTIQFDQVYALRLVRLLLNDSGRAAYRYAIETSGDGQAFEPLVDRRQGQWTGWQEHRFSARAVKVIKLLGVEAAGNKQFSVVEIEAYCIPPLPPPPADAVKRP